MKIHGVMMENFMLFDELKTEFSPNINILIGENSTGKTALMKALYASAKAYRDAQILQERKEDSISDWGQFVIPRMEGVFAVRDGTSILGLANRCRLTNSFSLLVLFNRGRGFLIRNNQLMFHLNVNDKSGMMGIVPRLPPRDSGNIIYIPTGEMISHTENFASLYERYRIPFDETCYDLVRLLDLPQMRELPEALQAVVNTLEKSIGGKVVQQGRVFSILMNNDETIEMSLISDGYRKLATLLALLGSGALADGSILFWDEPESNMNPRMVQTLVNALIAVAAAGVQVFVSTHDYFVQQYFGLAATYREKYGEDAGKLDFRFFSLYREAVEQDGETDGETPVKRPTSRVAIECAARLVDLEHNPVNDEYNALGGKEMKLYYGDDA